MRFNYYSLAVSYFSPDRQSQNPALPKLVWQRNSQGWFTEVRFNPHLRPLCSSIPPDESLSSARQASSLLFSTSPTSVSTAAILSALGSDPRVKRVPLEQLRDQSLTKIAAQWGLVESNSTSLPFLLCGSRTNKSWVTIEQAKQLLSAGGLYLNNEPVVETGRKLGIGDLVDGQLAVLRAGKHNHIVLLVQ